MKFENIKVMNFEGALRGMRNPKNSWDRSDSHFGLSSIEYDDTWAEEIAYRWVEANYPGCVQGSEEFEEKADYYMDWLIKNGVLNMNLDDFIIEHAYIGPKDMKLAKQLVSGGSPHDKFLRQIFITIDITAPLYWWKEMDTYKVATVANSTSTMHKLASTPITLDCFEIDDYDRDAANIGEGTTSDIKSFYETLVIPHLEQLRKKYLETNDKRYWKELVRWLPEGWLQTRTWTANYATLREIYKWRKNHKLTEWHQFCKCLETLPYANEFIIN